MNAAAGRLARLIGSAPSRLVAVSEADASVPRAGGHWSRKQVLGHLIDSASNNHQRIVRAQLSESLDFPSYQQAEWVRVQHYSSAAWPDLVNLWLLYNRHLLHVVSHLDPKALDRPCRVGDAQPITLQALIEGYVDHLKHHLEQIFAP